MTDVHTINPSAVPPPPGGSGGASAPSIPRADITAIPTSTTPAAHWYNGVDNDLLTHWQHKGYDLSDPKKVAIAATKGQIEATKFLGVPPHQLLRLPDNVSDEVGWANVWQRLGAPADKTGYDFSQVKFADGTELDAGFSDFMREKAYELHLPTSSAVALSRAFVDFMESSDRREGEQLATHLAEEKAQLAKDWGNQYEFNRQTAVQGAQKLGVTADDVAALEKAVGYSRVMEMFRKVGAGSNEDAFVQGKQGGEFLTGAQTAQARLNELMANPQWGQRLVANDPEARREYEQLTRIISGYVEEAT
jgi:hypothetical protein